MSESLANTFKVPSWAGQPHSGLHLDVLKETKLIQKLMIDEKKCYFFGRNRELNDFHIDHASCSRVHAALVWHKVLMRPFIIDLGSTHGTFVGSICLEKYKPQPVIMGSEMHFGASTRRYIIRERPQKSNFMEDGSRGATEDAEAVHQSVPFDENELQNLTEFNTAHNRRIAAVADVSDMPRSSTRRKQASFRVSFNDDDEVINPEDIDPSVGRFRNLVNTTVIPKKAKLSSREEVVTVPHINHVRHDLYGNLGIIPTPVSDSLHDGYSSGYYHSMSIAMKLGLPVPDLAPDIESELLSSGHQAPLEQSIPGPMMEAPNEPRKKKYAKEMWPGKKPIPALLV